MSWSLSIVVIALFAVGGWSLNEANQHAPLRRGDPWNRSGPRVIEEPDESDIRTAKRYRRIASACFVSAGAIGFLWAMLAT